MDPNRIDEIATAPSCLGCHAAHHRQFDLPSHPVCQVCGLPRHTSTRCFTNLKRRPKPHERVDVGLAAAVRRRGDREEEEEKKNKEEEEVMEEATEKEEPLAVITDKAENENIDVSSPVLSPGSTKQATLDVPDFTSTAGIQKKRKQRPNRKQRDRRRNEEAIARQGAVIRAAEQQHELPETPVISPTASTGQHRSGTLNPASAPFSPSPVASCPLSGSTVSSTSTAQQPPSRSVFQAISGQFPSISFPSRLFPSWGSKQR